MREVCEGRQSVAPVVALFLMAPLVGEVLGAAMRLSYFAQPLRVLGVMLFYGAGAVLIREVARRLGLNWWGVVLLAVAFALIEEGLALQTIFNPEGPGEETIFGRAAGVNWYWAVVVCGYHVVWSVLISIAVVEYFFPRCYPRRTVSKSAWLSKRATAAFAGLFLLGGGIFLLISFLRSDYRLPLHLAAATLLLVAILVWAATRCVAASVAPHLSPPRPGSASDPARSAGPGSSARVHRRAQAMRLTPQFALRRAPRPATVAWFGLLAGVGWFVLHLVAFIGGAVPFLVWIAVALVLAAASAAQVTGWTRTGWTPRHFLALAFGLMLSATLFGLLLVLTDGRLENTIFQLVLLVAVPTTYTVLKRTHTPQLVG